MKVIHKIRHVHEQEFELQLPYNARVLDVGMAWDDKLRADMLSFWYLKDVHDSTFTEWNVKWMVRVAATGDPIGELWDSRYLKTLVHRVNHLDLVFHVFIRQMT